MPLVSYPHIDSRNQNPAWHLRSTLSKAAHLTQICISGSNQTPNHFYLSILLRRLYPHLAIMHQCTPGNEAPPQSSVSLTRTPSPLVLVAASRAVVKGAPTRLLAVPTEAAFMGAAVRSIVSLKIAHLQAAHTHDTTVEADSLITLIISTQRPLSPSKRYFNTPKYPQ